MKKPDVRRAKFVVAQANRARRAGTLDDRFIAIWLESFGSNPEAFLTAAALWHTILTITLPALPTTLPHL